MMIAVFQMPIVRDHRIEVCGEDGKDSNADLVELQWRASLR